eukprot:scaffold1884_cov58-Cylindrotheca_fusiformis.AAC.1
MESTPRTIFGKGSNVQSPRHGKSLKPVDFEGDLLATEHGSAVSSVTGASEGPLRSGSSVHSQPKPLESSQLVTNSSTMLRVNSRLINKLTINKYNMEAVGLIGRE